EAERLAASSRMTFTLLRQGRLIPVPSPEKALRFLESQGNGRARSEQRRTIVGSPATVRSGLQQVAADYGADEVIVVTITYDHGARMRSYELIAEALGLEVAAAAAGAARRA
ncbi:MAG: hypothetical protein QOD44_345, partial [Solirubrobacteraceae bacterium]|nr:hypothetical protein [Solirubrobacteraceae bacterium]